MATARANARLALMLAIGDLQKTLGPDRAVTATSDILAANPTTAVAKPNIAGAWESWWDFNPNSSPAPAYTTQKTSRFRRWLVSSADPAGPTSRNFVTTAWTGKTVELVGNGALGANATAAAKVTAGLVPVAKNGKIQGSYAWHVSDESVKARINTYRDPSQNTTYAQKRALLAGHRPDPSVMRGPDGNFLSFLPTDLDSNEFALAKEKSGKLLDLDQVELLDQARGNTKQFRHDVTPYSLGVLADVRRGGLKQDLSSVFEMSTASGAVSLPTAFSGATQKLYQSTTPSHTGVSDPYWSNLWGYYNMFRRVTDLENSPTVPVEFPASAALPAAATAEDIPKAFYPVPVIAKVDMVFSLAVHPVTDVFWFDKITKPDGTSGGNGVLDYYDYFVDLIYTPVVTLHNPYNVSISFHKMSVEFENVPVAFNFMLKAAGTSNFVSQSVEPGKFESINGMTGKDNRGEKKFGMTIANWTDTAPLPASSAISGPIVMKPGQTVICGLSKDPAASFGRGDMFDWVKRNEIDLTKNMTENNKALPKFTPGLGFELDGVTISNMREHIFGNSTPGAPGGVGPGWCTFLLLRDSVAKGGTDQFYVDFKAQVPSWHYEWDSGPTGGSTATQQTAFPWFNVTAKLQASAGSPLVEYTRLKFDYNNNSTLDSFFKSRTYTYPPTKDLTGAATASPPAVTYAAQFIHQHPFAIFSAYARTSNGGVYETGKRTKSGPDSPQTNLLKDGRLAGKPFLFHNAPSKIVKMALATDKPGEQSYELNLQPFVSKGDYSDYMDVDINRIPALTGNTITRGIKSGSYLEIPTGPMQTIADFRRSNALTTSYLPHFVQPVGNSLLHPLMSPNRVMESNPAISATALLDHSVLANHALYDRFYFSTFATRGAETPDTVFEKFMNLIDPLASTGAPKVPLPSQSFQPYLPNGKTGVSAKAELFTSGKPNNTAYQKAAEYQMVQGPFNVNSTSIQAWKAVLASMNKSEVATLWAKNATQETNTSPGVPILAMSLLNGGLTGVPVADANIDNNTRTNDWNGYRELDDAQLTTLATEIVKQVRLRGPFLSMSEFVNRQIGADPALTLSGALEKAISDSGINDTFMAAYVTPLRASDFSDIALYNYKTTAATSGPNSASLATPGSLSKGNPAAGAPGWISQGDLMRILEPAATVRSDTFVIRVCGEAQDASGTITARAYAEAVVQRVPEYVDPVDRPSVNAYDITLPTAVPSTAAPANKAFGRRMNVVSFRWLSSNEI